VLDVDADAAVEAVDRGLYLVLQLRVGVRARVGSGGGRCTVSAAGQQEGEDGGSGAIFIPSEARDLGRASRTAARFRNGALDPSLRSG
jgi:hypothetical protein